MKKKSKQNHETNIRVTEIDYDKLAKSITKAIIESKNEEDKKIKADEKTRLAEWHRTLGITEHKENENIFVRKGIDIKNGLCLLKAFIFYKKDYARTPRMAFGFMAMISSLIFSVLHMAFIIMTFGIVLGVIVKMLSPWFLCWILLTLTFAKLMNIIRIEIEQMENKEMINMIFSSLMAFIAALFTVLAFVKEKI